MECLSLEAERGWGLPYLNHFPRVAIRVQKKNPATIVENKGLHAEQANQQILRKSSVILPLYYKASLVPNFKLLQLRRPSLLLWCLLAFAAYRAAYALEVNSCFTT